MRHALYICAALLAASPAYAESECHSVPTVLFGGLVRKNSSFRAEKLFAEIVQRSGIEQKNIPALCEYSSSFLLVPRAVRWGLREGRGPYPFYAVILSRRVVAEFSDDELRGVIAHELGHVVQWSRGPAGIFLGILSTRDFIKEEMNVDALGAGFVGREAIIKALRAIEHMLAPREDQLAIRKEVRERIRALRLLPPSLQFRTLHQSALPGALFSGKISHIYQRKEKPRRFRVGICFYRPKSILPPASAVSSIVG